MKKKLFRPIFTAWVSVITHKLRSFLTILGVVIGVAAVIILMSVGKGTTAQIINNISSLGTNLVYVQPGSSTSTGGVRSGFGSASTLTLEDAEAIADEVSGITAVAPYSTSGTQVIYGSENMQVRVTGITTNYEEALNIEVAEGEFFTDYQYETKAKVALVGSDVASTLFGEEDPVGEKIKMSNTVFTVIGLLESKGSSMMNSTDQTILVPLTTLQGMMSKSVTTTGQHTVNSIDVLVEDKSQIDQVKTDITALLETRHKIALGNDDDFSVSSTDELISTITSSTQSMTLLLGAIAGISLLVGGIGVMNIMLVSVMERRKEIGVRKALGAQESAIWGQFLVDSSLLTFTGGIIGVAIGWGGSYLINYMGWMTTVVTTDVIILAVSVSVAIGLFFGFYPAWSASRLNPIEALRSE
jgi:putative ABC transport system permease protein